MSSKWRLSLILVLPLLTACDPQPDSLRNSATDINEPLTKLEYEESGSRNFKIQIVKVGADYQLSVLEDGASIFASTDRYVFVNSLSTAYSTLESLFKGTLGLKKYENPCPSCLSGYWSGFSVTLKKDSSHIDVDVDAATELKLHALIDAVYLILFPPQGLYQLVSRSCLSGAIVNDGFDINSDSLALDFVSATEVDTHSVIGGLTTFSTDTYSIVDSTLHVAGEALEIHLAHGMYSGAELTLTSAPFFGGAGSCPDGDRLVSVFQ